MADGIKTLVRYEGRTKLVTFTDTRLAESVERFIAEEPPGVVLANLDAPPGTYAVESRTNPGHCWEVRLDPERGVHVGQHNCPARAENPRANYPCRHITGAWLRWHADREAHSPFNQRLLEQEQHLSDESSSTALANYEPETGLAYYVPSREHISDSLALAKVLYETRGAAIPEGIKTVQEAAAIIMAGEALGMDPMTSFRRIFTVNGRTQPDGQCIAALIQAAGGDLVYHEASDEAADIELIRPGRPSLRIKYTMAQAKKAGINMAKGHATQGNYEKAPWRDHPADMLVWKAVTRLGRRGAADIVNKVGLAMVRVDDFNDEARRVGIEEVQPERPILTDGGVDRETGEIMDVEHHEIGEEPPSNDQSEAESESAHAATPSGNTTSEAPLKEELSETPGPAQSASAESTSSGRSDATTSDPSRSLNYATAFADKAANHKVLSAFQRAVKGMGTLPADAESMTLDEIVTAVGGQWPE